MAQYNTLDEALAQAVLDGYLSADNVKNFVCLVNNCGDTNNLYRIIGVFNGQVKLIKYDYANAEMLGTDGEYSIVDTSNYYSGMHNTNGAHYWYTWNKITLANAWSESGLNTINLNTNYWNYLGSEYQGLISKNLWQVGGNTWDNIGTQNAKEAYNNEIISPNETITYEDEIGLLYISDYLYAADPSGWQHLAYESLTTDYRAIKGSNWMYMGDAEWTITRAADYTDRIFHIGNAGNIGSNNVRDASIGVRPVFYLNADVEIYAGNASTKNDPYRVV